MSDRRFCGKLFFSGFVVCLALLLAWGCEQEKEPIKIGLAINLSGRGGTAGEYIRDGVLLAVEDVNAAGGINGRPLTLLVEDDKNDKDNIKTVDERLMSQGVIAIIGHSYSQNTLYAHPVVTKQNTLLFTPYTATTKLTGKNDLFCRTSVDNNLYGKALSSLLNKEGITNVSFLLDMSNPSFVEDYLERTTARYGGKVTPVRFNSKKEVDWPRITKELLVPGPQAVVMLTEVSMTGIGAQKLRAKGFSGGLFATLWAQTPELARYGGKAVEGMKILTFINPNIDSAQYKAFNAKMKQKFNKPATARSARSYEAVQILADALKECPANPTAADLKTAMLKMKFTTLMGPVSFDPSCDVARPVYVVSVQDGKFITIGEAEVH